MIFRLSQKLNSKIKAGTLPALPLHKYPFADWSADLFVSERTQYILLCNTKSLYSTVLAVGWHALRYSLSLYHNSSSVFGSRHGNRRPSIATVPSHATA